MLPHLGVSQKEMVHLSVVRFHRNINDTDTANELFMDIIPTFPNTVSDLPWPYQAAVSI